MGWFEGADISVSALLQVNKNMEWFEGADLEFPRPALLTSGQEHGIV